MEGRIRALRRLTTREREVALLCGRGLTDAEIAVELMISRETVRRHLSNARLKLDAVNRTELAVIVALMTADDDGADPDNTDRRNS